MGETREHKPLVGIHPETFYPETELRRLIEISALRRAKREGMPWFRIGRTFWIMGSYLIEHFTR